MSALPSGAIMAMPKVRLLSVRLKGYRSCKATELEFEPDVTVLIGPNGAGKTNLMRGLQLLRGNLRGRPSRSDDDEPYSLRTQIIARFALGKKSVGLKMDVTFRPGKQGADTPLSAREFWDLSDFGVAENWANVQRVGAIPGGLLLNGQRIIGDTYYIIRRKKGQDAEFIQLDKAVVEVVQAVNSYRRHIDYYSASQFTNPSACPTSFEVDEDGDLAEPFMARKNTHLKFIHDLYRMSIDNHDMYENYHNLIGREGIHLLDAIAWKETAFSNTSYEVWSGGKIINRKRERILIIPVVSVSGQELSFDQLSEGTFRALATIFHLVTDASHLLLLEEPEVCVHHGLLASLIQVIKDSARKKQILISTHSESFLDSVDPRQVRLIKRGENTGTKASGLSEAMSSRKYEFLKTYLREEGNLGEYWRHSGFDQ